MYGIGFNGATAGLDFDDLAKTSIISVSIVNCGEVDLGTTNNGAELLNFALIDPLGAINNYGLVFNQTPSASVLNHNVKQGSFITSGVPTTQYMLRFPESSDYSIAFADVVFYGNYGSGTLWHGLNQGTNADITITITGGSNPDQTEFSSTAAGTVTVSASAPVTITVLDNDTGLPIANTAHIMILKDSDKSELSNGAVNASGVFTYSHTGVTPMDITGWVREMSLTGDDYTPKDFSGTILSTGFAQTVKLEKLD